MPDGEERVLIVEPDLEISDLISRQTLIPMGYKVQVIGAAAQAIQEAVRFTPDVIIANLSLPGLSGKDFLVGLSAQGIEIPVIVIASKGMENDVIQAFRLGAADFISQPLREAEVVSAVERVLNQTRARREKEQLTRQLNQTNLELQRHVRELTTIFAIGKAVTSITDPAALFDKIIEGAVYISEAELGWLHLRDDRSKNFLLSAHKNMPASIAARLNQTWDDGLSSLVALSGESFAIHGDPLKRFKVAQLGQSALVVPVKVKREVVGLLVVMRKKAQAFTAASQALLEAVADYASISLVNARLFRVLQERARASQQALEATLLNERIMEDRLSQAKLAFSEPMALIQGNIALLAGKKSGNLTPEQAKIVEMILRKLQILKELIPAVEPNLPAGEPNQKESVDISDLARRVVERFQPIAQHQGVTLVASLLPKPMQVTVAVSQVYLVIEGLLYNALRSSPKEGKLFLRITAAPENCVTLSVQDQRAGIDPKRLAHVFDQGSRVEPGTGHFSALGISPALIREIIAAHKGKVWVESKPGSGTIFNVCLPVVVN